MVVQGHTSQRPATQHWPALQSSLVVHWGAPASPPVAQGPQLPALQHWPAPHWALAVHWHAPHWRVVGSQHWPAWQSSFVLQQGAHAPPMQHWPAPQAASEQHWAVVHWPPLQQRPAPHCALLVQLQASGEHWCVPGSQQSGALQSRLLLQHGWHEPPIQHVPGPQSVSVQHAAVTQAPVSVQHLPAPQSPWPGAPVQGHAPHFRVSGSQHCPAEQSSLLVQHGPATHAPLDVQHWPAPQCASLEHLHALLLHVPSASQHWPAWQSRSVRQHGWHW